MDRIDWRTDIKRIFTSHMLRCFFFYHTHTFQAVTMRVKKKRFILTCGYSAQRKVRGHAFRSGLQKSCSVPVCRVTQVKAPSLHHLAVKDALRNMRNMKNSHLCVCVCVCVIFVRT